MLNSANKKEKFIAIALILLLTMSSALSILPTNNAQAPQTYTPTTGYVISNPTSAQIPAGVPSITTGAGVIASPNPVGVGQYAQIIMLVTTLPASAGQEAATTVIGGWLGFTLTITKPDGTKLDMGPYMSDPTGAMQVAYMPEAVGTYTIVFNFPGELVYNVTTGGMSGVPRALYTAYFTPLTATTTLTVQQEPIQGYHEAPIPLPTEYWSQPINAQNRYWNSISGPWLMSSYNASSRFNPYTYAPDSAHIVWTKSMQPLAGGLAGGDYGSLEFQRSTGFTTVAIMGGYVYYNGPTDNTGGSQFFCAEISTGKIIWSQNGSITSGQILNWRSQQSKIEVPYLWSISGTTWKMYDARTGALRVNFGSVVVPSWFNYAPVITLSPVYPTTVAGSGEGDLSNYGGASGGGTLIAYVSGLNAYNNATWLACWNSTLALLSYSITSLLPQGNVVSLTLPAAGSTINWAKGIQWNVTIPVVTKVWTSGTSITTGLNVGAGWSIGPLYTQIVGQTLVLGRSRYLQEQVSNASSEPIVGVNADTGAILWSKEIPVVPYQEAANSPAYYVGGANNVFLWYNSDFMKWQAYSVTTGDELWTATPMDNAYATQSVGSTAFAYGNLYNAGYDGYMHCISLTNGTQLWQALGSAGNYEMPESNYPMSGCTVADGKVFTSTAKSYENEPLYRGHKLFCFDAYTGQQLWNISGQDTSVFIANSYLLTTNNYDGQAYCFGRGQTATTITAPMTAITAGSPVVIQGTVTDQSPGAIDSPAIADKDMSAWMEYKYMDQPMPTNAQGVPVSIDAVDPNNNFVHLGDTISDNTGTYIFNWMPPNIPGTYRIIATFTGSNSYFSSSGETGAIVVDAPAATSAPVVLQNPPYEMYTIGSAVAVIIAIALAVVLILRKRP